MYSRETYGRMVYSKPTLGEKLYQLMRTIHLRVAPHYQTSRAVSEAMEFLYQTRRYVLAAGSIIIVGALHQTKRSINKLASNSHQTIRYVSLFVLPVQVFGQYKRYGDYIKGRFKRK